MGYISSRRVRPINYSIDKLYNYSGALFYVYRSINTIYITTSQEHIFSNNIFSFLCPKIKRDVSKLERDVIILEEVARVLTIKRNINLKRNHNLFKYSFEKETEVSYIPNKRSKIEKRMERVKKYIKKFSNMIPVKNEDG